MTNPANNLAAQLGDLVIGIDHVAIAVEDIDTAIARYSAALGFNLIERSEVSGEHSGMLYTVMRCASASGDQAGGNTRSDSGTGKRIE